MKYDIIAMKYIFKYLVFLPHPLPSPSSLSVYVCVCVCRIKKTTERKRVCVCVKKREENQETTQPLGFCWYVQLLHELLVGGGEKTSTRIP